MEYSETGIVVKMHLALSILFLFTVKFVSAQIDTGRYPCQMMHAKLDYKQIDKQSNGNSEFKLNAGQEIMFSAMTDEAEIFSENDSYYHQSISNINFIWNFGDGTMEVGQDVSHFYENAGTYNASMYILDNNNCSSDTLNFSVIVVIPPQVLFNFNDFYCSSDTLFLTIGSDTSNNISIVPQLSSGPDMVFNTDTTVFIPDGPYCSTLSVKIPFLVNSGNPGTIITADDIRSVCVNMEHSYAGDLSFALICPDSVAVILDSYDNSGPSEMGIPNNTDGTINCDSATNPPGLGWLYCWSEYYPAIGILNAVDAAASPIPATDTVNNVGYLVPESPFAGFVTGGCHLDGTWILVITDSWVMDNGYVFGIQMRLSRSSVDTGAVITDTLITGPGIIQLPNGQWAITGVPSGTYQYTMQLHDSMGNDYPYIFPVTFTNNDFGTEIQGNNTTDAYTLESYYTDYHPGAQYLWTVTHGSIALGQGTDSIQVLWNFASTGYVTVNEAIGSCMDSDTLEITILGIEDSPVLDFVNVFPNPASDFINVQFDGDAASTAEISITDLSGKLVSSAEANGAGSGVQNVRLDVSDLENGLYIARVRIGDKTGFTKFSIQ